MEIEQNLVFVTSEDPYHGDWRDVTDDRWGPNDGLGPYDTRRKSSSGSLHRDPRKGGHMPVVNNSAHGSLY
ncbi:hypothetical protein GF362_00680 [Candidatus Dojkabacteria bacterium]|nr:hypothetical protein [Candidatus Dojkabacteria bacterium]